MREIQRMEVQEEREVHGDEKKERRESKGSLRRGLGRTMKDVFTVS